MLHALWNICKETIIDGQDDQLDADPSGRPEVIEAAITRSAAKFMSLSGIRPYFTVLFIATALISVWAGLHAV